MSHAQLLVNLGLTSSAIEIVKRTQDLYNAASSTEELGEVFQAILQNIPLVLDILQSCKRAQEQIHREYTGTTDEGLRLDIEDAKSFEPLMVTCRENAKQLQEKFEQVFPGGKESARVRAPRREREPKGLMIEILEKLQLLMHAQSFAQGNRQQNEYSNDLATAINQLSELPSAPEEQTQYTHSGSGSLVISIGSGSLTGERNYYNGDFSFGTSNLDAK